LKLHETLSIPSIAVPLQGGYAVRGVTMMTFTLESATLIKVVSELALLAYKYGGWATGF
jgi:hypothetical protein